MYYIAILDRSRDWILGDSSGFFCQIFPVEFYGNSAVTLFNLMSVTINRCAIYLGNT